ncbi:hypothetical protein BDB01DRAFT_807160 [Pilobolus umbonatus]|nr:hypothetical protein BDB01DRAFT_807160 [Pilobolus umbonatus]
MGFFSDDIQKTSVSLYIERLSNLDEMDWYLLEQLTESIQMQENGPREAIETLRKKLKHGGTEQKLKVLEILKVLMENSNQKFHRQFIMNEKMKERFEYMISSPTENSKVKKELLSLLGSWSTKYNNEPGMRAITDLYERGRGKKVHSPIPVETEVESPPRPSLSSPRSSGSMNRRAFDFNKAKPKIIEEIAIATQNANNLVNALKLINTQDDRWEIALQRNKSIVELQNKCEESRKKIVRYTRLVEDEQWIGTLLVTNEELLKALDVYDIMLTGEIPSQWKGEYESLPQPLLIQNDTESLADPFADPSTPVEERSNYFQ